MEPGNLCSNLLHKFFRDVRFSKSPHIFEVSGRKSFHGRELFAQILAKLVDYFGSPALLLLPVQDATPNLPVQQYKLPIYGQSGSDLGLPDPLFQITEERPVADCNFR